MKSNKRMPWEWDVEPDELEFYQIRGQRETKVKKTKFNKKNHRNYA